MAWFEALPWYERLIYGFVFGGGALMWLMLPYHAMTRLDRIITVLERIANKK